MPDGRTVKVTVAVALLAGAGAAMDTGNVVAAFPGSNGKIAFQSSRDGDNEIFVMDADGQNQVQLTTDPGNDAEAAFSADGERIAYRSTRDGDDEIFVMDADGQNQVQLTTDPGVDDDPFFSPDGTRIAFRSNRDGDPEIFVMDADGQNQVPLTANSEFDGEPTFSPDGQRIAFSGTRGGDQEIFVMDADGQNQAPLTTDPAADIDPAFSPDGQRIAFRTVRDGDPEIFVMDADGQNPVPLTGDPAADSAPDWQPLNPPAIDLSGAPKQKSAKVVTVTVTSQNEDSTVILGGTVEAPKVKPSAQASKKKSFELTPQTVELQPGQPATVTLAVPKQARKLLKRAFNAGKKGNASVFATASDDLGASSQDSQQVKLKKKKKK